MAGSGHAVGNHRGEQTLDRRKQSYGERGRDERNDVFGLEIRDHKSRKAAGNAAELAADGRYGQPGRDDKNRADGERHDRTGNPPCKPRKQQNDGERRYGERRRLPMN